MIVVDDVGAAVGAARMHFYKYLNVPNDNEIVVGVAVGGDDLPHTAPHTNT